MMNLDSYKTIRSTRRDRVLTLTFDTGDGRNAVNELMHLELATVFNDAQRDPDSDVIVLTGAGRCFSAGGDMVMFRDAPPGHADGEFLSRADAKRILFSLLDLEKPIIAKVNGPAMGLGATLALYCDVIFAAESAAIADPHVRAGIVAGDGGSVIWPQLIGFARAKQYLLTGDAITAPDAAQIGLINYAVPDAELNDRVDKFADRLAAGSQYAIRWTKVATNIALKQLVHTTIDAALAYEWITFESKDHREAVNAFFEKRNPKFS